MRWREVRAMWAWELRGALRERSIVVHSVLVPLLLYPATLWLALLGLELASGQTDSFVSRVAVCQAPPAHASLVRRIEASPGLQLQTACGDRADLERAVRAGTLDAAAWFDDVAGTPGPADNFAVRLLHDGSRDRSVEAERRLRAVLDEHRARYIARLARARSGAPPPPLFEVHLRNVASAREMGAFLAGILIPLMLVVMVAVGAQAPAIDATAGERERGTWETLMTSGAARSSLLVGKYLAVVSLGALAGLLNLGAMLLTLRALFGQALGDGAALEVQVPLAAVPVLLLGTLAVALPVAALSMLLAAFARTYKDGQALTQPLILVLVLGVTLMQQPDARLTTTLALVPVANVMLAMRDALGGQFQALPLALTALGQVACVAAALWAAGAVLRAEDVAVGSFDGSLWTFVRTRGLRRPGRTS